MSSIIGLHVSFPVKLYQYSSFSSVYLVDRGFDGTQLDSIQTALESSTSCIGSAIHTVSWTWVSLVSLTLEVQQAGMESGEYWNNHEHHLPRCSWPAMNSILVSLHDVHHHRLNSVCDSDLLCSERNDSVLWTYCKTKPSCMAWYFFRSIPSLSSFTFIKSSRELKNKDAPTHATLSTTYIYFRTKPLRHRRSLTIKSSSSPLLPDPSPSSSFEPPSCLAICSSSFPKNSPNFPFSPCIHKTLLSGVASRPNPAGFGERVFPCWSWISTQRCCQSVSPVTKPVQICILINAWSKVPTNPELVEEELFHIRRVHHHPKAAPVIRPTYQPANLQHLDVRHN